MSSLATVLAVMTPLLMANERSLFHFPTTEDAFRLQKIVRSDHEQEWPFAVATGYLACVWLMGDRTVYFTEEPTADVSGDPRTVIVSTNPFDLAFVNLGANDLFAPFDGLQQLVVRLGPFVSLGRRLCDQPRGTEIGPGEL